MPAKGRFRRHLNRAIRVDAGGVNRNRDRLRTFFAGRRPIGRRASASRFHDASAGPHVGDGKHVGHGKVARADRDVRTQGTAALSVAARGYVPIASATFALPGSAAAERRVVPHLHDERRRVRQQLRDVVETDVQIVAGRAKLVSIVFESRTVGIDGTVSITHATQVTYP